MSDPTTTEATAPDTTPADVPATDVPATTEAPAEEVPAAPVDPDAAATAAFEKGVAEAKQEDEPAAAPAVPAKDAPPAVAPSAVEPAKPGAAAAAAAAPVPDAETDAAVAELGLKGRAEARFREMAGTIKELAPVKEALAKAGVEDIAQLPEIVSTAARAREWEETLLASTATPEQFSGALEVCKAINSGDPNLMNAAFDALLVQITVMGKQLGREVPGLVDPLEDYPELAAEVEVGDLPRKRALELVQQRRAATQLGQVQHQSIQQRQQQASMDTAMQQVEALNAQLKASDPQFAQKLQMLQPTLEVIRRLPPEQWVQAITQAYQHLPAIPAAPVTPPVSAMPIRPTGAAVAMQRKPKTDVEAFEMGVQSVSR